MISSSFAELGQFMRTSPALLWMSFMLFSAAKQFRIFTIGIAISLSPGITLAKDTAAQEIKKREIPFLTSRNRTTWPEPSKFFGDERSSISAGWCAVRALDLSIFNPLTDAAPSFIREELLSLDDVRETDRGAVFAELGTEASSGSPTLYIHGYNISFEKGCRRAILLKENAGLDNGFLWFSWPSDGVLTNYTHDEADLYWSVPDIADTILELDQRFGADKVNLVAHSLGARGLALALYEAAYRKPEIRFKNVVLLAPDMDFGVFQRLLPRIRPLTDNLTIYATSGDIPLALSAQLHGYPRLGETGSDFSALEGVEVIDLSELPNDSPTGHLNHIYSPQVGADLNQLLNENKAAADRTGLQKSGENMWILAGE